MAGPGDRTRAAAGGSMRSRRKWFVEPLALKLFLFVSVLVLGVLIPAGYVVARQYFASSLELKRNESYLQGHVIAIALEDQMLENRRDLIRKMIEGFSDNPALKRLMVVDHDGRVQMTNDAPFANRVFSRDSPTCQVCHAVPSRRRATSAVIEMEGGTVLRSVYPFRNRPACHLCHDPANTVNGVLITDTDITDLRRALKAQIRGAVALVGLVALVLLAGVTLTVRLLVLRRLERIERTTRAIADGDFNRRVDVTGGDAVSRLGHEFNAMADSVTDLLSQLRLQRTQLENVMSSVDDGMLVVDRTFTVVAVNKALAERIGSSRDDLLFRRCFEVWSMPCDCTRGETDAQCAARACFTTGQLHKCVRTRYTAEGAVREEEVFASPIVDADGHVEQVVEVWRDITERKSREARMAEFQRLVSLGMLASGFSHEVNTPLGTMLVHLDEVRRQAEQDRGSLRDLSEPLDLIRNEILRCRDLTRQFLQLSRGQSVRCELLDLPGVVRSTIPLMAHVASHAGVALRVVENETAPVVTANGGAVRQVLLNILLNAVQASQPGGEVRVLWRSGSPVCIRVEDDGIGMPPEVREKVFEPFFTRQPSGTGLGLFVSLNLVRQWGGDIQVTSMPGHGSAFEVVFPPAEGSCLTTAS
jgi:PAS domain S-box-containing protein